MNIKEGKVVVFFDVDNTIINGYSLKFFIKYLTSKGIINKAKLLLVYMWFIFYKLRIIKNVEFSFKFLFKFLAGWKVDRFRLVIDDFFEIIIKNLFFKEAVEKIKEHLNNGDKVVLVSTSIYPIVEKIAKHLNIEDIIATKLEVDKGVYTGNIEGNVLEGKNKLDIIKYYLNNIYKRDVKMTIFYTDHYSDLDILYFVDKPIVVNPGKAFLQFSKNKGWDILNFN